MDPENSLVLMETHLPTPMTARVELLIYQRVPSSTIGKYHIITYYTILDSIPYGMDPMDYIIYYIIYVRSFQNFTL